MEEKEKREFENLEAEVFKALDHQMRRDILRYVGEGRDPTFTGILNAIRIPDSPTLAYHLKSLAPFIEQRKGRYHLTPMGKDAFNMLLKAGTYGKMALFQKKQWGATLGNALLWGITIIAAAYLEVNTILWAVILPFNAFISVSATYQLFK
jgi:hypothetical protein